jgi:hypothetical protein
MLKTLAFTAAITVSSALLATGASAVPLAQDKLVTAQGDIVLVRDGCGPGRRYSRSARRCVGAGPVGRVIRDAIRCGPGRHYSRRWNRCVRN